MGLTDGLDGGLYKQGAGFHFTFSSLPTSLLKLPWNQGHGAYYGYSGPLLISRWQFHKELSFPFIKSVLLQVL